MPDLPDPDVLTEIPPDQLRSFLSIYHALAVDLIKHDGAYARAMETLCQRWTDQLQVIIDRVGSSGDAAAERTVATDLIKLDVEFAAGIGVIARQWTQDSNARVDRFRAEGDAIMHTSEESRLN